MATFPKASEDERRCQGTGEVVIEKHHCDCPDCEGSGSSVGCVFVDESHRQILQRLSEIEEVVCLVRALVEHGGFVDENYPAHLHKLALEALLACKAANGACQAHDKEADNDRR